MPLRPDLRGNSIEHTELPPIVIFALKKNAVHTLGDFEAAYRKGRMPRYPDFTGYNEAIEFAAQLYGITN